MRRFAILMSMGLCSFACSSGESEESWADDSQALLDKATSITPEADAFVRSGAYANTKYGTAATLEVDTDDAKTQKLAYLRFRVGDTGPLASAKLRLFVRDPSPNAGTVASLGDPSWSEATITYNARPSGTGTAIRSLGAVTAGQWVETDVSSAVKPNSVITFLLNPQSGDGADFDSREGANPPRLVLTPVDAKPTATIAVPAANATLSGTATFDAAASDDRGVAKVEFYLGSTLVGQAGATQYGWIAQYDTSKIADGSYALTAKVTDTAGQISTSAPVQVTVQNGSTTSQGTWGGRPLLGSSPAPTGYQLKWSDEFNDTAVDATKWNVFNNSNYGATGSEDECYLSRNATESGGTLKLTAKRETVQCGGTNPDTGNSSYYFTSGMLTTRAAGGALKYKFNKGYAEASIMSPKGNPYWAAFWLVGPQDGSTPGWPDYGEFDITELTAIKPDITHGSFHYRDINGGDSQGSNNIFNLVSKSGAYSSTGTTQTAANLSTYDGPTTSRFVRYGFLWEANRISWYVDGVPVRSFDGNTLVRINADGSTTVESTVGVNQAAPKVPFSTVFNYDHSIILNLSVGGRFPRWYGYSGVATASGYSDGNLAATMPAPMEVDYVRVYQLP